MSINLGLDGLRKAVIRASLFLNDLPGETHSLGNAMFQQRVALTASATRTRNATRNSKSALKASKERLQEIRITEALERPQRALDNLNKAQQRFTLGQSKVQQRYQAGQGVVDKIGAVSGQAMSVARQRAKLLQPGYQALTVQPAAATPGAEPSPAAGLPPTRAAASADNLAGDIARLNGAIEAISIAIFQQLDGTLSSLTQTATGLLGSVDRWIQANPALAGGMAQLVAGGVILVGALGAIGSVVAPVLSGLNLLIAGAGEWIGKALGDAFMLPLKIFNDLSSGIIGLMEKLGLIDKKSADAQASLRDQTPAQPPLSALGGAGESFPQSEFPVALGGARYKPVTATTSSSSQQNTFNSSYVINVPAGMGEADVRTLIENHEQQTRARAAISQRSSYLG